MNSDDLLVTVAGWEACRPSWSWRREQSRINCFDLWFLLSGRGELCLNELRLPLYAGQVILYPKGLTCTATHDANDPLTVSYTHFETKDEGMLGRWLGAGAGVFTLPVDDPEFLGRLLFRFWESHRENAIRARAWFLAALLEINRCFERKTNQPFKLFELKEQIQREPSRSWQVEDMARFVGVSGSHLTRLFRKLVGCTPHRYVIDVRLAVAKSRLMFTDQSLTEIADELGYPDPFTFSKQFRKHAGCSPREWRQGPSRS